MCRYKVAVTCDDANTHKKKIIPFGPDSCQCNEREKIN